MLLSRWNVSILILIGLLLFLQYRLWFNAGGIRDMVKLKQATAQQVVLNDALKKQNAQLIFEINRNNEDEEAIGDTARNDLGMIKKGETYYQIVH